MGSNVVTGSNDFLQPNVDTTSVLKTLTTQKVVGTTVDPGNGDQNPHGLAYVSTKPFGKSIIKKGDLVVCNYSDKNGVAGNGTTLEYMTSTPGSAPKTFIQDAKLKGCSSVVINGYAQVYADASLTKTVAGMSPAGKINQTIVNKAMVEPWNSAYVASLGYPPGDGIMASDPSSGKLLRIDLGTGKPKPPVTAIISGFPTNKGAPGNILGPAAVLYNQKSSNEQMYVVDSMNNTVYSFVHAYDDFHTANSVIIGADGKSFTGPKAKDAKVLYSGGSLNAPITATLLPNGNLVIGNTGTNALVEIASNGKVLATKSVDKGAKGAIFGVIATGTNDGNTQIYFNDDNANNVQVLQK